MTPKNLARNSAVSFMGKPELQCKALSQKTTTKNCLPVVHKILGSIPSTA